MAADSIEKRDDNEKTRRRLYELLELQKNVECKFGERDYNVFVFGSYLTTAYKEGLSDIDIAIYSKDFSLYKRLSLYLEEYFNAKNIKSDIFYIDTAVEAAIYCAPLKSQIQFTDYFPPELVNFEKRCQGKLEEVRAKVLG